MINSIPAPRITVLLISYNHAKYVAKSLESILRQRVDEAFNIVVADDGSSDETLKIISDIALNHPHISFTYLDHSLNLGITRNYQRAFKACQGEYVAIMEGDDYWISPLKLAAQRDFLDAHWECDLCSVNYLVYEEERYQFSPRVPPASGHILVGARDLIADNLVGNFSTCMYRRSALNSLPEEVFEIRSYDWAINICIGRNGLIGFLKEPMSVYRIHGAGTWSLLTQSEKLQVQLELIPAYDKLTGKTFHAEFSQLADRLRQAISGNQIAQLVAPIAAPESFSLSRVSNLMPPLLISFIKLIVPPTILRFAIRLLFRGQA